MNGKQCKKDSILNYYFQTDFPDKKNWHIALTLHITDSKKQSDAERGAALFAVRVHVIVI